MSRLKMGQARKIVEVTKAAIQEPRRRQLDPLAPRIGTLEAATRVTRIQTAEGGHFTWSFAQPFEVPPVVMVQAEMTEGEGALNIAAVVENSVTATEAYVAVFQMQLPGGQYAPAPGGVWVNCFARTR